VCEEGRIKLLNAKKSVGTGGFGTGKSKK